MDLGKSFYFKLVGICIACGLLALVGFLIFNRLVYRFGMIGGLVIIAGILMLVAWRYDKKQQHRYDDGDEA